MPVFDSIAEQYERLHGENPHQAQSVIDLVAHLSPHSSILDLGCGTGTPVVDILTGAGHQVLGIDVSEGMLAIARRKQYTSAFFHAMSFTELPNSFGKFDAIVAHFALLMLPRLEIITMLRRAHGWLKPDGWLSIAMVDFEGDGVTVDFLGVTFPASGIPQKELEQTLVAAGFSIEASVAATHSPEEGPAEKQLFLLARASAAPHTDHSNNSSHLSSSADFLFELGHLKRLQRSGWRLARMATDDTVAAHSFRAALLAIILAGMRGTDPAHAALVALVHDIAEARTGDVDHLAAKYLSQNSSDVSIITEQCSGLPPAAVELILSAATEWKNRESDSALIAKDADILEAVLHVRESLAIDHELCQEWLEYLRQGLLTPEGGRLFDEIQQTSPDDWWKRLVRGSKS